MTGRRYFRPDYYHAPDCPGDAQCNGRDRCPVFGIPGMCQWPCPIVTDNTTQPYWYPDVDASLAERWLP